MLFRSVRRHRKVGASLAVFARHAPVGWAFVLVLMVLWEIFGRLDTSGLFPPLSEVLAETVGKVLLVP